MLLAFIHTPTKEREIACAVVPNGRFGQACASQAVSGGKWRLNFPKHGTLILEERTK